VRVYRYQDAGGGGLVSAKYVYYAERWAAVNQRTALEVAAGGAGAENIHAVIDFSLEVDLVRYNDLLVVDNVDTGDRYYVRGRTQHPNLGALLVTCERVKREQYLKLNLAEAANIADGSVDNAYEPSVVES
jgi:hypothetical protein